MKNNDERIVITGMGVVSPLGNALDRFWQALCNGRSGIGELTRFDTTGFAVTHGGEVSEPLPREDDGFPAADTDMATRFMHAAALAAMRAAGRTRGDAQADNTGVVVATNFGAAAALEQVLESVEGRHPPPLGTCYELGFQACADRLAGCWNLRGPRAALSLSCSSGTAALVQAADWIRAGHAEAVLAGGYDAITRFAWSGLAALRTMTKDAIRPFDMNRSGTVFGEGAGALLLERRDAARARGATILAEYLGGAANNNAHHMTAPAERGAGSAAVMRAALADAGLAPEAIGHINAHGTGTKYNDVTETEAIKDVFGGHAYAMPITAIKSSLGHMMGAAGAVEAIASILTLRDGVVPPTINWTTPDAECDLDVVTNLMREVSVDTVLSNSAGIGGCNAAIILGRGKP